MIRIPLEQIVDNAIALCDTSMYELGDKIRAPRVVLARELAVTAARLQTPPYSYPAITRAIGRAWKHTTCVTAFQRVDAKYPKGLVIAEVCGIPATFWNLVYLVSRTESITEPAVLSLPRVFGPKVSA
jgi:hypothetical protein